MFLLKLSGGPGNVPTCAERTLTRIAGEFNPIAPSETTIIRVTGPLAQAAAFNGEIAVTEEGIDFYIAAQGVAVLMYALSLKPDLKNKE